METHYIAHGSEEWWRARNGKFTPSEVHKLMTPPKSKDDLLSKGAITYIKQKISEELLGDALNTSFSNEATDWGNNYEDEALQLFADMTDTEILRPGFITKGEYFGGTPDGIAASKLFGIEIKCPFNPSNHLDNLLLNEVGFKEARKAYYWQVQGYMWLTGIDEWYFVSYDPRQVDKYKLKTIKLVKCEEDVMLMRTRMEIAWAYKNQLMKNLNVA